MKPQNRFTTSRLLGLAVIALVIVIGFMATDWRQAARFVYTETLVAPKMSQVSTLTQNISYCHSTNQQQRLDIYSPKNSSSTMHPFVVYVHGGGWHAGDKSNRIVGFYGPTLVKQGMTFVTTNYRLAPNSIYPSQNQDVSCALSFLYQHAAQYHIDRSRLALFGDSAGGELVAYAALADQTQSQPWHRSLRGVVDLYGVSSFTTIKAATHLDRVARTYLGPDFTLVAKAASPISYSPAQAAPFLLFHGMDDHDVPIEQAVDLTRHLQKLHAPITFIRVNHAGHGFSAKSQPTSEEIREQVTTFLRQNLFSS